MCINGPVRNRGHGKNGIRLKKLFNKIQIAKEKYWHMDRDLFLTGWIKNFYQAENF